MKTAETELKSKLQKLEQSMDSKWTETLKKECDKLRREINSQKDEERRAEIERIALLKEEEMAAAKQGWEVKLRQLLDEVFALVIFLLCLLV